MYYVSLMNSSTSSGQLLYYYWESINKIINDDYTMQFALHVFVMEKMHVVTHNLPNITLILY